VTYAAVLGVLAVLSMAGAIKDWSVWAGAIAAVNLFVFSYSQATKQGPELRVELQQYVVLASAGEI
jgi:hypothetical protein